MAKETALKLWSEDLDTAAGQQKMFKMANQMRKDRKDVLGSNFFRDPDGNVKVDSVEVLDRWRGYFEDLLNAENPNVLEDTPAIHGPVEDVSEHEVVLALRGLKSGKAAGPSEVTSEMFSLAGETGTDILLSVFRNILRNDTSPGK